MVYLLFFFFFFNDTATTEIYTLSLHDALPISRWRARFLAGHDVVNLIGVERLPLEQRLRHLLDLVAVILDDGARAGILLVNDAADLPVHQLGGGVREVLVRGDVAPEEHLALVLAVDARAQDIAHAPAGDHVARDLGGALEVVGRARGHLLHEHLFGDASAHEHGDGGKQTLAIMAVAV